MGAASEESEFHFQRGRILDRGSLRVTAVREDIEDEGGRATFVFKYAEGKWSRSMIRNRIAELVTYQRDDVRTVVLMAQDGEVLRAVPGAVQRGRVDTSDSGPSDLRHLIGLTRLGSTLLAYGMRRQIYRSDLSAEKWERADEGVFIANDDPHLGGFWSIDGRWPDALVAVGLGGELWTKQERWVRQEVPSAGNLYAVKVAADGTALACGAKGVVLRGRDATWRQVENTVTTADLWGIAEFRGKTYLAGGRAGLFAVEGDAVVKVEAPGVTNVSSLDVGDDRLLVVGDQQVVLFDGTTWTDLAAPIS